MPTQSLLQVPAAGDLAGCCKVAISVLQQNPPGEGSGCCCCCHMPVLHQSRPLPASRPLPNRTASASRKVKNETAGNYFSSSAGKLGNEKNKGGYEGGKKKRNLALLKRVCIDMYCTPTCGHSFVLVNTVRCSKSNSPSMSACININQIAKYLPMQMESLQARQPFKKSKIK